jgi:hypothetical protein
VGEHLKFTAGQVRELLVILVSWWRSKGDFLMIRRSFGGAQTVILVILFAHMTDDSVKNQ